MVEVQVDVNALGTLENLAEVDSATEDPNPDDNQDTEETPIEGLADLSVTKSDDPDPVEVENLLTYSIIVTNNGPNAAEDVVVTDVLPPDVTYVDATPTPVSAPYPIIWHLGNMDVGEVREIELIVFVEPWAAEMFTNTVSVSSDTEDPNPDNSARFRTDRSGRPNCSDNRRLPACGYYWGPGISGMALAGGCKPLRLQPVPGHHRCLCQCRIGWVC